MTHSDATTHDQPPNRLAGETSPYLLQHAHNPVDWYPWGPQAIETARRLQKPIFLSIGYSTCYWCHVMERQIFENEAIARQMNEGFVCIKVDREERPDLDEVYMASVQLTTGHGGWPMSVFLTPPPEAPPPPEADAGDLDGKGLLPFYAGTYFPPEPSHGMPSFPQVLAAVSDAWRNRPDDVRRQALQVAQAVREHLGTQAQAQAEAAQLSPEVVQRAANQLLRSFDPEHGGFGRAPKFPQPSNLLFLMRIQEQSPNADLAEALRLTLERMARGGMYDQVGGGFHRYSVDEKWLVPHFEKMLYDNAQLIEAYLVGQTVVPDERDEGLYPRVVRETADYVLREMTSDDGAFYSAQDAEVDSREGQNYLWTPPEVQQAMSPLPGAGEQGTELTRLATAMFGLDQGTNFRDPHHADAPASNVLYLPTRLDDLAAARGLTMAQLLEKRHLIRQRLLEVRMHRPQPRTDDKAIASWNGMMIAALAMAGRILGEPRYVKAAERAAATILEKMRQPDGSLLRTMRRGEAKIPAFLEDYAFLAHGLIELGQATGDPAWVRHAQALTDKAIELFDAGRDDRAGVAGGFFDTLADQADLFVRVRSTYDGALPGGNSQMVHNLLDLFELTGQATYLRLAAQALHSFAGSLASQGHGMVHMQHALMRAMTMAPYLFETTQAEQTARQGEMTAEVSPNPLDLSTQDAAVVRLHLPGGYHVHAHDLDEPGLTPTTLELAGGDGLAMQVEYPPAVERRYPLADRPLRVYEGEVAIKVRFASKSTDDPKEIRAVLVLRAQPCTEQACLQARELAIPMTVIRR